MPSLPPAPQLSCVQHPTEPDRRRQDTLEEGSKQAGGGPDWKCSRKEGHHWEEGGEEMKGRQAPRAGSDARAPGTASRVSFHPQPREHKRQAPVTSLRDSAAEEAPAGTGWGTRPPPPVQAPPQAGRPCLCTPLQTQAAGPASCDCWLCAPPPSEGTGTPSHTSRFLVKERSVLPPLASLCSFGFHLKCKLSECRESAFIIFESASSLLSFLLFQ